ncbi:MAG TPA: amidohydrolase family protein [Alphaproteobacteria bacterium]|jgi:predicted TIM-barrel fold metal-dependent hydrolase
MTTPRRADTPLWPPKTPRTSVPAGAWDCHFHVFTGPEGRTDRRALSAARNYDPPSCGLAEIRRLHDRLGFARGVIVQGSVYGTDNRAMTASLRAAKGRYRGIAVIDAKTPERALDDMAEAGVRGVRVNVLYGGGVGFEIGKAVEARVKARGWHIQLLIDIARPEVPWGWLERASVPLVFDHFGHFDARRGATSPGFQRMLGLVREGRAWVKITGPTRISAQAAPEHEDVRPLAAALMAAAPDRLVWGSDWPHVALWGRMPDDGDLVDDLARWGLDEGARRKVFVDNPRRLYGP